MKEVINMTLRNFIDYVNRYAEITPSILDYEINAVAYNEYGDRDYEIPMEDVTIDKEKKIIQLWDF
jgi:hypothetical protein